MSIFFSIKKKKIKDRTTEFINITSDEITLNEQDQVKFR